MDVILFHEANELFVTILALLANSLVVWFTLNERNGTIRTYHKMMIATCVNEFVICLCSLATMTQCQINGGYVAFISSGPFHKYPLSFHYVLLFIYVFKIGIGINVIPVEYYFRYRTVCQKSPPSSFHLGLMLVTGWGYAALSAALYTIFFSHDQKHLDSIRAVIFNGSIYEDIHPMPTFVAASYLDLLLPFVVATIGVNGAYALAIYWGWRIYNQLKSVRHLMTAKTAKLQTSMTVMLTFQALFPFMSSSLPVCIFTGAIILQLNASNLSLILGMIVAWMPLMSPLCTILLLGLYRRRVVDALTCIRPTKSHRHVTEPQHSYPQTPKFDSNGLLMSKLNSGFLESTRIRNLTAFSCPQPSANSISTYSPLNRILPEVKLDSTSLPPISGAEVLWRRSSAPRKAFTRKNFYL